MKYNNRMFPHPVAGISDDVVSETPVVKLKVILTGDFTEVYPQFKIDNDDIKKLIASNKACYVSQLYCRGTMFREIYISDKSIYDPVKIDASRLNGEVEMDFFVCSIESITSYTNKAFNPDYGGQKFSLDKADLLAYLGQAKFHAKKSPEELKSISSLIVLQNTHKSNEPMRVDFTDKKINIALCSEDYDNYLLVKKEQPKAVHLFVSCIVLPVLVDVLHRIMAEKLKDDEGAEWHRFLSERIEKSKDKDPFVIAQNILDTPNYRAFNRLVSLIDN